MSFQDWGGNRQQGGYGRAGAFNSSGNTATSSSGFGSEPAGYQQGTIFNTPAEYDNNFQAVSNNIRQVANNVEQIRQLTNKIGSSRDGPDVREKLQQIVEETKRLVKDTNHDIKALDVSDSRKRMLQQKLIKDFQSFINKFQEINKIAVEKEKANPAPPSRSQQHSSMQGSHTGSFPGIALEPYEAASPAVLEQTRNQQLQLQNETAFNEALITDRDQGIKEIEKTVLEVNEIFRDLNNLVVEQGVMIDNIESNIDTSVQSTTQGTAELRQASDYQKKARTKMCCLLLLLSIILGVVVLVVYLFVAKK